MFSRAKIIAIIFIAIFVYYFAFDYSLINIEKTALIVSLGVDKAQNEYEITAQIALPEASNSKATNNESVISAKGKTLYDAVSTLGEQTGWYPKLSFCNLIVLGNGMMQENVMNVLDFFLRSYKVEDTTILCASEGSAKELLKSSSPLDNISGLSLSKIFVRDYKDASRVLTSSIKTFSIGYYSRSQIGYVPIVKMVNTNEKGEGGKTSSASTLSEPNSGSNNKGGDQGGEQELVIYDASSCALFKKGIKVATLQGDQTLCYSFINKGVNEAFFSIDSLDSQGRMGNLLLVAKRVDGNQRLIYENDLPVLNIDVTLWLKIQDANIAETIEEISKFGTLSEKNLYDAKTFVENKLTEVFNVTKLAKCDFFEIKNSLYKYHHRKYEKEKNSILENLSLRLNVKCKNFI